MVTTDRQFAYLLKVQRDARDAVLPASIGKPTAKLADLMIIMNNVGALAIAFEQCKPDEVARWVALLLNFDSETFDEFEDEDAGDEFD